MRVLMTGGGTGGHVNPAIAIANTIKANNPDAEIAFVGTKRGIENKLVASEGYPVYHVEVRGFKRSLSPKNIKAAYLALVSPLRAKKIIREFSPDIVIGTGGYVCWPVLVAASKMNIPTMVHESNALPGVTVRQLQKYVDKILLNFKEAEKYLTAKNKLVHVGNPLRSAFGTLTKEEARKKLGIDGKYKYFILSYGGSLGAEKVNNAALELMKKYVSERPNVLHVHATGSLEHDAALSKYAEYGLEGCENIQLLEYIYDMPVRMAAADIVISRAGAMTVSELSMMKKAAVLIPSPNVTDNHQYKNAKVLADAGAAILIEERELVGGRLVDEIASLCENSEGRRSMEEKIGNFANKDANRLIYNEIMKLIKSKTEKSE